MSELRSMMLYLRCSGDEKGMDEEPELRQGEKTKEFHEVMDR